MSSISQIGGCNLPVTIRTADTAEYPPSVTVNAPNEPGSGPSPQPTSTGLFLKSAETDSSVSKSDSYCYSARDTKKEDDSTTDTLLGGAAGAGAGLLAVAVIGTAPVSLPTIAIVGGLTAAGALVGSWF